MNLYHNDYIKFRHDGVQSTVLVQQDDLPTDPREWDNIDHMTCFHSRYRLGDRHDYRNSEDFSQDLARQTLTMDELRAAIKAGRTNLVADYDKEAEEWEVVDNRDECIVCKGDSEDELFDQLYYDDLIENISESTLRLLVQESGKAVMLPLYLYDHSGLTMNTTRFSCPWDSGQIGWIYMTKEIFLAETGWGEDRWPQRAFEMMRGSVETYDQYLTGDVYGFTVYENTGTEENPSWDETDNSCWGFYGSNIKENGIADNVPGLLAAIESGAYETGTATEHRVTTITYDFD